MKITLHFLLNSIPSLTLPYITRLFALLALILTGMNLQARESVVTPAMAGHWKGDAHIIVNWCQQPNLPVLLDIQPDGTVTGKIGDATLTEASLKQNRGWIGRKLNLKTDYIISGGLSGPLVASEGIKRSHVKMPLSFTGGTFRGGIHTSGSKFGGKDWMILSATLKLTRRNTQ